MAHEPQHSETMSGAPPSSEPAGFSADAALILAALGRIGTVVRDEQAALERLRVALADMAQAIARAKTVADSETAAAMLDEFEHRVDAMIELAGGGTAGAGAAMPEPAPAEPFQPAPAEQAAAPVAQSDQVPTVSGVVLRLGPGNDAPPQAIEDSAPPPEPAADEGPTVAMLTAMVEALSASIQTPAAIEAPAAEPAALPGDAAQHETALLASFEQMEARPFPPPDEGTAVIFAPRPAPEPLADVAPEPPPEPEQAAAPEPMPEPELVIAPQPAAEPVAAEAMESPPPMPDAVAASADADFDPADFLFGPEPEPDPAAFLLDPAPQPDTSRAALLPQPEFVSPTAQPEPAEAEPAQTIAPAPAAEEPQPAPEPHDPLRAIKALTPEERLAIFS